MTLVLASPVKSVAPGSAIRSVMTVWYYHNRSRLGECDIETAWVDPSGSNVNRKESQSGEEEEEEQWERAGEEAAAVKHRGVFGECAALPERTGTEDRLSGLPMAARVA